MITKEFAKAIVDKQEGENYMGGLYCIFCGKKHASVLHKPTGFFIHVPTHLESCVVIKAQDYLKGEND